MNSSVLNDGIVGLREVMSQFATGVTVLTVGGERVHGMTANAFTSLSVDPPQVLCCVAHTAVMHDAIRTAGGFAVSILHADQERVARYFADRHRPLGPAQFASLDWLPGSRTGAPLIGGALAWMECELVSSYEAGDHTIFIGGLLGLARGAGGPGLLFFDGGFGKAVPRAQ
ncbi:flavin reductase family protein [Amycolatopsis umgeniensis]|uniref:Flavin reductase (DIM6/NTAB) family NADH-FMN oxidoreductase RutF n=1 Tax=Amycolatopsis umgeniensis TaxID=336628 RepID=A0A841BG27_9PSEU|nr:flavin reductase family protein [Amycolatopsis umgeniensis]MBB5857522.1 flavin reductase (DIM6/NTAB) family NADH-FMN oxidoreductase RutF [Amycolatopsis umgeniensis]